jgi:ribonuclease P protein component
MNRGALRAYVRRNEKSHARLGVIVGRRWAPRAVDRNRVKRLVRESFRQHAGRLGSIDVIVQLVAPPTGKETNDLDALWLRLGDESGDATRR